MVILQDVNGLSAAHMAALEGHTNCVTVLASHRAYLNFTDYSNDRYIAIHAYTTRPNEGPLCNLHLYLFPGILLWTMPQTLAILSALMS